jgi:hypothetical protein
MLWIRLGMMGRTYESGDAHLGAGVTELCERSVEQAVLLPERLDVGVGVSFRSLEGHVCIGDFWDWRAGADTSAKRQVREELSSKLTNRKPQQARTQSKQLPDRSIARSVVLSGHFPHD